MIQKDGRDMTRLLGDVTAVLMARMPEPGRVKTRLVSGGVYSGAMAADLAWAMLRCTAQRLSALGRLVLAVSPDGCGPQLASRLGVTSAPVVNQGGGDLGERLNRVWGLVETARPIAFFGGDCPDVPDAALGEIAPALARCDVAVGPAGDGGYWTLAARQYHPALLQGIDWGSDRVYDQTFQRATGRGLTVRTLPAWHDVDYPQDVEALRRRLRDLSRSSAWTLIDAEPLRQLAERLDELCSSLPAPPGTPR
ncbi:MAG: TIGR04282 family arsenosugar biosynthesis glycosyltransferase [Planctomycetes bacterium]|nr:TIGR04282 family arsenosugar biosynthesis glycosyltransferase [Planctomycetota bacterium]